MNKYKIEKFDWNKGYFNCLWNDGIIAIIHAEEGEYHLFVNGDVRCDLIAKTNIIYPDGEKILKGSVIAHAKGNGTAFFLEMSNYIKDDKDLERIICGEHPLYDLEFENNNWIEMDLKNKDGYYEELDIVLDSCMINESINEAIKIIKNIELDNDSLYEEKGQEYE